MGTRPVSVIAPEWWDYTTLDDDLLQAAAKLDADHLLGLSRPGFTICAYDTIEQFYCAEAMEYVCAWGKATPEQPTGICGPVGPTEQLPLVADIVNSLELPLHDAHFWAMDEWVIEGEVVPPDHPLSFARTNLELMFGRIHPHLAMPRENIHFPTTDPASYIASWDQARCVTMQGGQGEIKHWAFNDPPRRAYPHTDTPPPSEEYRTLGTRIVDLHPLTLHQNARTSAGGALHTVPTQAVTVGPRETWKAEHVSIWHAGTHDNPFGMRLTTLMLSERVADAAVPMSLLADHPNVTFHFLRSAIGTCDPLLH